MEATDHSYENVVKALVEGNADLNITDKVSLALHVCVIVLYSWKLSREKTFMDQ